MTKIIKNHLNVKDEITILVGARQVGKTTLLNFLAKDIEAQGIPYVYLNLDFEEDAKILRSQLSLLKYLEINLGNSFGIVFIDEIQRKENAGLFLKGIFDRKLPYKLVVTGSGSIELKEKISESLTGRKRTFVLHPVSFSEFVDYKTGYKFSGKLWDYLQLKETEGFELLREFLSFGGYPKVILMQTLKEKSVYIREIFQSYIEKDVSELLGLNEPVIFSDLIRMVSFNEGGILKYSSLAADLKIHPHTVKKYLWYAEKTYIVNILSPFYRNLTSELRKPKVLYFEDIGLSNYLRHSFKLLIEPSDLGFRFQNFVFQILRDFVDQQDFRLNYWRTSGGAEVDFVINKFNDLVPIEVKFKTLKKPVATKALYSFINTYKPKEAFLINLNLSRTVDINGTKLHYITWLDFLKEFSKQ